MPTHYHGKPEEVRALNTFIKLSRATDSFHNSLFSRGILEDLTPSQFSVLETLFHLGSLCQGELSRKLLKSSGNMTLVIDNLEKRGLVRRERRTDDRRMITIALTPGGRMLIERVFPLHVAAILEQMSVLTPEEQEELGRLSRKLGLGVRAQTGLDAVLEEPASLE